MNVELSLLNYENQDIISKILEWRNEEEARNNFINTNIISKDILDIILQKYKDSNINPYIINNNNIPIGMIYFTNDNNKLYIGINIDKEYRSQGIGNISLKLVFNILNKLNNVNTIYAKIKKSNEKSNKLFSKYFILESSDEIYNEYTYYNNLKYVLCSTDTYYTNKLYQQLIKKYSCNDWKLITTNQYFKDNIIKINPEKCFFLHWPYIVPKCIYEKIECINFHTGNLPDGRGGSPLQNQIMKNIKISNINSLKITNDGIDSGPSYNKTQISLQGNIFDIFILISDCVYNLINEIIEKNLKPDITYEFNNNNIYNRIKDNHLKVDDLENIYDQIRMRDFKYYEKTYINFGDLKLSFSRPYFDGTKIICDTEITKHI